MGRPDDAAKAVLAEYHAIRDEYNSLDRRNPAHAKRRQELKARYYELNLRYARLTGYLASRRYARTLILGSRAIRLLRV